MVVSQQHGCSSWCLDPESAHIVRYEQQMRGPLQSESGRVEPRESCILSHLLAVWASAWAYTGSGPGLLTICLQSEGLRSSWFIILGILSFLSAPLIVRQE